MSGLPQHSSNRPVRPVPIRRAAVWLVVSLLATGAILSWASIQGGGISPWVRSDRPHQHSGTGVALPVVQSNETLARGARIQTMQCAGCHQSDERSSGPSYRDIAARYRGQGDSMLADLTSAVGHPPPGWSGFSPGPTMPDLPESDRQAVADWILQSNSKGQKE